MHKNNYGMTKALFFDIDGTLVPFGEHAVPREVREAIATLRQRGIKVFIASGRQITWIDNLGDMEFDGYVTVNGAVCLLGDRTTCIHKRLIDRADIERVIPYAKSHPYPFAIVPPTGTVFINKTDTNLEEACAMLHIPPTPVFPIERALDVEVAQMMGFLTHEQSEETGLFSEVLTGCKGTSWNPLFCDIVPRGSSKAVGIDHMLRYFDIPLSETMAFGDGGNDIEMLRHVAIGVAMGNSAPDVKAAADYVTTDILDNGVTNALRHFGLL